MSLITTNHVIKFSKATLMLFFSFFGLLVMYSNITDYATNYEYLSHILSMDTVDASSRYSRRAITSPILQHRIYWLIITFEVMYTTFCILGTYNLYKNINSSSKKFHEAKKFAIIGLLIALFLYYLGFQVIGAEWFNMDQSKQWNYKDWAQHIVDFMLPSLLYLAIRIER